MPRPDGKCDACGKENGTVWSVCPGCHDAALTWAARMARDAEENNRAFHEGDVPLSKTEMNAMRGWTNKAGPCVVCGNTTNTLFDGKYRCWNCMGKPEPEKPLPELPHCPTCTCAAFNHQAETLAQMIKTALEIQGREKP